MKTRGIHHDDTTARRTLRDNLIAARLQAGITKADLSRTLGYTAPTGVTQMEHRDDWELPTLQLWAWALDQVVVFTVQGLPAAPPSPLDAVDPGDPRLADEYDRQRLIDHTTYARERLGVSWAEMGRRMGCSAWAAQKWFAKAHTSRVGTAQRVVRALGGVLLVEAVPLDVDAPVGVAAA